MTDAIRAESWLPMHADAATSRPCADCNGDAIVLSEPAPNGARVVVMHQRGCPFYTRWATQNGDAS